MRGIETAGETSVRALYDALRRVLASGSRQAWAAGLLFLVVSLAVTARGRDERSGWTLMTSPAGHDHRNNTLLGYSWLRDGRPFMKENIPCVSQVGVFAGSLDALSQAEYRDDFRLIRGFYSFAASFLAPLLGILPAMLAVNWLSWAACAAIAYEIARGLSGDRTAGLLAALFVAAGIGPAIHIGDYSPHLLAFATYYGGVLLLVRTGVYRERRPWTVHVGLGLYFAICCLAYNTGVKLVAVYLVAAAFKNRWRDMAAAAAIALPARSIWQAVLGSTVRDVEAEYLSLALEKWKTLFSGDPAEALATAARLASEFLFFFDSPAVVVAGLVCCLLLPMPWPLKRLGLISVAMPFLAAFVFAPAAGARGYLVYAGTAWVYACLAVALATWLRGARAGLKPVVVVAVALLLCTHLGWATAHLWNHLGPAKTYFLGWDDGLAYFAAPTEAVSLTGREPTPVLFGGDVALGEAGAVSGPPDRLFKDRQVMFGVSLLSRGLFVLYLVVLAAVMARTLRRRLVIGGTLVGCLVATAVASPFLLRSMPVFFPVDQAVVIPGRGSLRYEVSLSPDVTTRLTTRAVRGDTLGFFFRPSGSSALEASISADGEALAVVQDPDPLCTGFYRFRPGDRDDGVATLSRSGRLTLTIRNPGVEPVTLSGWQRPDLTGRALTVLHASGKPADAALALPAFEVRLVERNGHLKLAAF